MAAEDKLSIFNEARVEAGEETITSLTDNLDAITRAFLARYGSIVQKEIETGEWRFCVTRSTIALTATDTSRQLPYQYLIPDTSLGIIGVRYLDSPLEGVQFEIEGESVWAAYASDISFEYKFRADESLWPRRFADIIVRELTAIAMRATERHGEAQGVRGEARIDRIVARHAEARQRHNRPMGEGSIVNRRRGGSGQLNVPTAGTVVGTGGGGSGAGTEDGDALFTAGAGSVAVVVGIGYVEVDCSLGDRTIVFNANDDALRKECTIRKTTAANNLIINDGLTDVWTEPTQEGVTWRRAFGTLRQMGRSA